MLLSVKMPHTQGHINLIGSIQLFYSFGVIYSKSVCEIENQQNVSIVYVISFWD